MHVYTFIYSIIPLNLPYNPMSYILRIASYFKKVNMQRVGEASCPMMQNLEVAEPEFESRPSGFLLPKLLVSLEEPLDKEKSRKVNR